MNIFDEMFQDEPETKELDGGGGSTTYEEVQLLRSTDKAWQVRFAANPKPKWVAKKQSSLNGTTLEVTDWLVDRWKEEGFDPSVAAPEEMVSFPGCMVMRETEAALWVQIPDKGRVWLPKSQVMGTSEVKEDGDQGILVVSEWIAQTKGLTGPPAKDPARAADNGERNAMDDLEDDNE